jgi:hypothetical protein
MICRKLRRSEQSQARLAVLSGVDNKNRNKLLFSKPFLDQRKPIPAAMLKYCGEGQFSIRQLARLMQRFDEFAHGWAGFG